MANSFSTRAGHLCIFYLFKTFCAAWTVTPQRNHGLDLVIKGFAVDCLRQDVTDVVRYWYFLDHDVACCNHLLGPQVSRLNVAVFTQASACSCLRTQIVWLHDQLQADPEAPHVGLKAQARAVLEAPKIRTRIYSR